MAEALALLGVRPVWDDASRRVTGLEAIPSEELGRPRIDVTLRISGFFRDAFPHTIGLLDDAVRLAASLDEPAETNHVRAHVQADLASHGDERRATTRIFGSRPGTYGAGLLQLIDSRDWRTDADLAEVYTVWGGYAYGRELDGRPAREEMETAYKRIEVAAKNTDTREHDIADSDDYFQYHGGMVATVRALRGTAPEAYIGDSTRPETVRTRTLVEETSRVFRARVVNPKWIEAMRRHGYKGAFELAATVDYLFGYDATTGVIADWMYDKLTETYVLDETNREFLQRANPGPCTASPSGSSRRSRAACGRSPTRRYWKGFARCTWRRKGTWRAARADGRTDRAVVDGPIQRPAPAARTRASKRACCAGSASAVSSGCHWTAVNQPGAPRSSRPSAVPSAARAVTSSPSPSRSTRWWW